MELAAIEVSTGCENGNLSVGSEGEGFDGLASEISKPGNTIRVSFQDVNHYGPAQLGKLRARRWAHLRWSYRVQKSKNPAKKGKKIDKF